MACNPERVSGVTVAVPGSSDDVKSEKRLWQVEFPNPRAATEFTVGVLPQGAKEIVAWKGFQGATEYDVTLEFTGGKTTGVAGLVSDLKANAVHFQGRDYPASEFTKRGCVNSL